MLTEADVGDGAGAAQGALVPESAD
jgi:hypothetical protein